MIPIFGVDPIIVWIGFFVIVFLILALDLGVFHRKSREVSLKEAILWTIVMFAFAMGFALFVWQNMGTDSGLNFITGYLVEFSLSIDNMFVFILIFTTFGIHAKFQHRVLYWGIIGALVMRGIFIYLGLTLVNEFEWVFLVFAAILMYGAYKIEFKKDEKFNPDTNLVVRLARKMFPVAHRPDEQHFFTKENGRRAITVLFLSLIVIEMSDVIFAFDSVPAIFGITTDPFIVFTSNVFAILGLRSLYFVFAKLHSTFNFLKDGVAIILVFIACKLFLYPFGYRIPTPISLAVIVAILVTSVVASVLLKKTQDAKS